MEEAKKEVIREAHQMLRAVDDDLKKTQPERAWMLEPMLNYFDVLQEAMSRKRPMIWHFLTLSQEPLRSMDAAVFSPEYAAAVFSILGIAYKYYDLSADKMPEHICVLNRFPAGLSLSGDTVIPDMMLYPAANPCDAGLISYSSLAPSGTVGGRAFTARRRCCATACPPCPNRAVLPHYGNRPWL